MHFTFSTMRIGSLNLNHDALVRAYAQHYQTGGGILPAFQGAAFQDGAGIGDVLRSIFQAIFPIVASGASSFIRGTADGLSQGRSLGEAAKAAIGPTASDVAGQAVQRLVQRGAGRKRRKIKRRRISKKTTGVKHKRRVFKRKHKVTKKSAKRVKLTNIPINF